MESVLCYPLHVIAVAEGVASLVMRFQIRGSVISAVVICAAILPAVAGPTEEDFNRPLWGAIRDGDSKTVTALLEGGAEVNARDDVGSTPLIHAVVNADIGIVRLLLEGRGCQRSEQERGDGLVTRTA